MEPWGDEEEVSDMEVAEHEAERPQAQAEHRGAHGSSGHQAAAEQWKEGPEHAGVWAEEAAQHLHPHNGIRGNPQPMQTLVVFSMATGLFDLCEDSCSAESLADLAVMEVFGIC